MSCPVLSIRAVDMLHKTWFEICAGRCNTIAAVTEVSDIEQNRQRPHDVINEDRLCSSRHFEA